MILILTTEEGDFSHLKIIDWLTHLGADYKIISGESILKGASNFTIIDGDIIYDGVNLTQEVSCVFYRRWFTSSKLKVSTDSVMNSSLSKNLTFEIQEIKRYLFNNLKSAIWFPNPYSININKLSVLEQAKNIINVPDYIITNNKIDLVDFYDRNNGEIITKAIGNFSPVYTSDGYAVNPIYTKEISTDTLNALPDKFPISFIQKKIRKILEYRVFYFNRKIYPTAILSQENKLTQLDSRENDSGNESKLAPAIIDNETECKLIQLMDDLNLNIGSIDMLHSIDDKLYFLEINPVGQIGGYSRRSGFNLEKIIAENLYEIDHE